MIPEWESSPHQTLKECQVIALRAKAAQSNILTQKLQSEASTESRVSPQIADILNIHFPKSNPRAERTAAKLKLKHKMSLCRSN